MFHTMVVSWSGDKFRTRQWVLTERQVLCNKNNNNATLIEQLVESHVLDRNKETQELQATLS